ncbi:MAG: hypothetical protein ACOC7R_04670 [Planctomycetota bacterium]
MPVPLGTNAAHLKTIGRGGLLTVILLAPMTLMWPSVEGWTALGIAMTALLAVWLGYRALTGGTQVPGHWVQAALLSLWLLGTYHVLGGGVAAVDGPSRALGGQVEASLATQAGWIALLMLLTQDWLAAGRTASVVPTALGLAAIVGAFTGLLAGTRTDGRLMLAMMGWTGAAMLCRPVGGRLKALGDADEPPWRRLGPRVRLGVAAIAAAGLSVLCPSSVVLALAAAAVTLLIAAVLVRTGRLRYAAVAVLAAALAGAHARDLGWLRLPAWPRGAAGWIGRGGTALAETTPWTSDLALLIGIIGWGGVAWLVGCLLIGLALAMRTAIRNDLHGRALLGGMTLVLAATAWLTPGGLFSPGVNVLFAVVWALGPMSLGRQPPLRSGWRVFAVATALSIVLALVGRIGLLAWMAVSLGRGDTLLHLFVGWIITQMLLWLLSGRRLAVPVAVGVGVLTAGLGEVLQAVLSTRSAQWRDFIGHLEGTALAVILYLLVRLSLWSESPDLPARTRDDRPHAPEGPPQSGTG